MTSSPEERLAADLVVETLVNEGVTHVFGLPGTTVMHLLDAMYGREDLRYISTRHEQVAGFMADGFARGSGRIGVCLASRGPGAANLTIAIDNAYQESVPVLAVVGQVDDDLMHRGAFEELDLVAFFEPITGWAVEVHKAERIQELVSRAVQVTRAGRSRPTLLSLPLDVLMASTTPAPARRRSEIAPPSPDAGVIAEAADLLATAQRPVIVVGGGGGAPTTAAAVARLARVAGAPVAATWHRKAVFPDSDPAFVGVLGFGAFDVTTRAVGEADVVVAIGCRFSQFTTQRWTLLAADTKLIHIDIDPDEFGRNYDPAVAIWSDAARGAEALAAAVESLEADGAEARSRRAAELRDGYEAARELPEDAVPSGVSSAALVRALQQVQASQDPVFLQDAPTFGNWMQRYLLVDRLGSYIGNAGGAMGWGLGAAMGVQLARPDERVVVVMGDGGFWMVAQDLETAVREHIPVVVVIPNNSAYGNIRDRQRADHGGRHIGVFYDNPDLAEFARLVGAHGERVERDEDLDAAMARAFASGLPAVVDVIQDRNAGLPPDVRPPISGAR